jgi:hypothetical protein
MQIFRFLKLVYREHVEFRVVVWLFVAVALLIAGLDVYHPPDSSDILVEAHGTLLDLVVVGLAGAALLYWRYRAISALAYYQMLRAADQCVDFFCGSTGNGWAYRYDDKWVLTNCEYGKNDRVPGDAPWRMDTLTKIARTQRERLDRLADSAPANRDPIIAFAILNLVDVLLHAEQYLMQYENSGLASSLHLRERVGKASLDLARLVASRADASMSRAELDKLYKTLMARKAQQTNSASV